MIQMFIIEMLFFLSMIEMLVVLCSDEDKEKS